MNYVGNTSATHPVHESDKLLAADDLFDFDPDAGRRKPELAAPAALNEWSLQEVPLSCIAPLDEEVADDPSSFAAIGDVWVEIAVH